MRRRRFLKEGARAVALGWAGISRILAAPTFDLLLQRGQILDGTGSPAWEGDIGITGDRITALGAIAPGQARDVLDIRGLQVCPGFIDIHSHSDGDVLGHPENHSRIRQGITTEITGNCGSSAAPLAGTNEESRRKAFAEDGVDAAWSNVASYCASVEKLGISVNQALLLGQGTLRSNAIGTVDRPLSSAEMAAVLKAAEEGMDQGAMGLSTGLEYTPGRFTPAGEIEALARVVSRYGGLYASHIRNEEETLLEAVHEAIAVGRATGVRVEISHLKAAGKPNWSKQRAALSLIESARRDGIQVLADAYPYAAYSTGLTIFLESWVLDGGTEAMMRRLGGLTDRARIRREVDARVAADLGSYELIVISRVRSAENRTAVGRTLAEIGRLWNMEPVDALLRLLEQEQGSVGFVGHGMSPENVEMVLAHPLVMVGSDGASMAPVGRAAESRPHPRSYGTCARVLGYYARERRIFDLPTAVRKMTSMPADQAGIRDRGRIAGGKFADLVVFSSADVADQATFESPHRYPKGIVHVLVNGTLVVKNAEHTGAKPGRVIRRS